MKLFLKPNCMFAAPRQPELGNFYEPSDSNTPARSTEGALVRKNLRYNTSLCVF